MFSPSSKKQFLLILKTIRKTEQRIMCHHEDNPIQNHYVMVLQFKPAGVFTNLLCKELTIVCHGRISQVSYCKTLCNPVILNYCHQVKTSNQ